MMKKIFAACLLMVIALSACKLFTPDPNGFPPQPIGTPTPFNGGNYPAVVLKARDALAANMNVSTEKIEVIKFEPVNWPDGCLGVSKPGVMCAMVITPGYRVILRLDNFDYEYHTDAKSTVVMASLQPGIIP
jgi:hypothetical protein